MTTLLASVVLAIAVGTAIISGQPTPDQRCVVNLCPDQQPCFRTGLGPDDYVCDCGSSDLFPDIGAHCDVTPDGIQVDRLDSCYGDACRTGAYQSPNWTPDGTGIYEPRDAAAFLLYIPGAFRIQFEFIEPFGVESQKDDIYVGVGLDFGFDQVNDATVGRLDDGSRYYFDNRSLPLPNTGVPPEFALQTDRVWIYFRTDKNIEHSGFRLTWTSLVDTVPPFINDCPSDITEIVPFGTLSSVVSWVEPTAFDNVLGLITVPSFRSHEPGTPFPTATTEVTYIFSDLNGNSATCTFSVVIEAVDVSPPNVTCGPDIVRQTPISSGGLVVNFAECTAVDDSGIANLISRSHRPGQFFVVDTTTIVTYTFTDLTGNTASDSFSITVQGVDDLPPTVTCGPDIVRQTPITSGGLVVNFPECTAVDDSGIANLVSRSHSPGQFFIVNTTTVVTYTFTDPTGNMASDSFSITIQAVDDLPPTVTCGPDIVRQAPISSGGLVVNFPECTAVDDSGIANLVSRSHNPGQFFAVDTTTLVTYTFTDPTGNTASDSFSITIQGVDDLPPTVTCGPDIVRQTPISSGGLVVNFPECTAVDDSGIANLVSRSHSPGQFFDVDSTTLVTYTFTDPTGNTASDSFSITIQGVDDLPPIVTCGPDIVRQTPLSSGGLVINFPECTAVDDSGIANLISRSHNPGQFFAIGTTTLVTYTFIDATGNRASDSFSITVEGVDDIPPVVTCGPDITETTPVSTGGAFVNFADCTAEDNSGVANLVSRTRNPGDFFLIGETEVTYTYSDPNGNMASDSFLITVVGVDVTPPVIACIPDVTESVPLASSGSIVFWMEPTATDETGVVSLQRRSHAPGSFFTVGSTDVTYVFVDGSGNTAECTFTVTVVRVDGTDPVVNCGPAVTETIPLGSGGTPVFFVEPTAFDNSGTVSLQSRTHAPGAFFVTGTTDVTYIFVDAAGNSAECTFTITIMEVDNTPPVVACIDDITRTVTIDSTGIDVFWTEPTATDNSGIVSLESRSHAPGFNFPVGGTQVVYVFIDPSGNRAECRFTVTVNRVDSIPPVVSCIGDITETTPLGSGGRQVFFTEPTASDDSGTVFLQQRTQGPGTFFTTGVTSITYVFADPAGNTADCTFIVTITEVDGIPPVVDCVGLDVTETIPLNGFGTVVQFQEPTATDNSGTVNLQSRSHSPGGFFQSGTTEVTYVFVDPSGNTAECMFNINVVEVDNVPPVVQCIDDVTQEVPLNTPGIIVQFTEPTATDNSGTVSIQSASQRPGQFFLTGTTEVTYTFADPSGNTADCVFNVIVTGVDNTPPDVACIEDITRIVAIDSTGIAVFWTEPTATDNSGVVSLQSRSHAPGDTFVPGRTPVTYIFTDPSGNTAICSFTITVTPEDNVPPVVSCIPDITETTPLGSGGRQVLFIEPTAIDDSGIVSVQQRTQGPGTFFTTGVTSVTYTFVDPAGNTAECTFSVIIIEIDEIPPVVNCAGLDVTETISLNGFGTFVQFQEPTATDNSGTVNLQSRSHSPGGFFFSGTTEVTYVFVDPSGNTAECMFNIIVDEVDDQPPQVVCPPDVSVMVELGVTRGIATWSDPVATDDSGMVSLVTQTHFSNSLFPLGETAVTYTYTDNGGNIGTCTFNVIVTAQDNIPPDVTCPQDIDVEVEINTPGTVVTWPDPVTFDINLPVTLVSQSHMSGNVFPVGITEVTYRYADNANNIGMCSFIVTVTASDNTPPVVQNCPATLSAGLVFGDTVSVTWPPITATDNSGQTPRLDASHNSGDMFPLGVTLVTYTFTDSSGNTADCRFIVTVASSTFVSCCPAPIGREVPLNSGGTTVVWQLACDLEQFSVIQISSSHSSGQNFPVGTTEVTLTFADADNFQMSCSFPITITEVDNEPPQLVCIDFTTVAPIGSGGIQVDFTVPTAVDNSGSVSVMSSTATPGIFFMTGETTVTYIFSDPSGNSAQCSFVVTVEEIDSESPSLTCSGNIVLTVLEGVTGRVVDWPAPVFTDNSGIVLLVSQSHQSGDVFPVGTTTVSYTYEDGSGNTASCSFDIIIVTDNPCQQNTCLNGGSCIAIDLLTTMCVCPRCFEGDVCQFPVDPCEGNLCGSGSTCVPVPDSCTLYTCECPPCFTGQFCTIMGDVCGANNCVNGAVCQPDLVDCTRYVCQCPPCFSGVNCEIRADGCSPNPCLNNGICSNLDVMECNAYRCDCVGCFSGYNCEQPIPNPCDTSPCLNGGTCTRNTEVCASYTCRCPVGFDGDNCEQTSIPLVNPCNSFPCQNGASCMSVAGDADYVCLCRDGYAGIDCSMMLVPGANLCFANTCLNGGTCFVSFDSGSVFGVANPIYQPQYVCLCAQGFTGFNCFSNIVSPDMDPCSATSGPGCQNGGTCVNTYNSFSRAVDYVCRCLSPFTGKYCERTYEDPCNSSPCQFGGTCESFQEYFICNCDTGFMGIFCQIPTLDTTPPVVTNCPDNIRLFSTFNEPVVGTWISPTVSDDSGFVELLFVSHMSGSRFSVGDTAVSYIYVDPSNNQAECSFVVTVDGATVQPVISITACPGDIVLRTLTGSAVALWSDPSAISTIGETLNFRQSHFSGQPFSLGTTVVTYTFTDSANNQASCEFFVTVEFETGITVRNCPSQVIVTTTDPDGRAVATWTIPEATATNSPVTTVASHQPNTPFPVGTTTVTYRFTDTFGNEEICSFNVMVTVITDAIRITNCPSDITQPAAPGGAQTEFSWIPPTGFDSLNNVIVPQVNRNPPVFLSADQELTITYTFTSGGEVAMCIFILRAVGTVADTQPPTVVSQPNTIVLALPVGQSSTTAIWDDPVVTDNSGTVIFLMQSHLSGVSEFMLGTTPVTYRYTDPSGNQLTVTFDVIVNVISGPDTTPPVIDNIPPPVVVTVAPNETAVATWVEPTATDDRGIATMVFRSQQPGSEFLDGVTQVIYIFRDAANNFATATFTVTVIRVTGQVTVDNCPANIERFVPAGVSQPSVSWTEPVLTNLAGNIPVDVTRSHQPGDQFPLGVTVVTYEFNVLNVIMLTCSFEVRVTEIIADQIVIRNCSGDITASATSPNTPVAVSWVAPTATFNGQMLQPSSMPPSNSGFFPVGNTTIVYTYTVGQMIATCSFTVIVSLQGNQPVGKRDVEYARSGGFSISAEANPCTSHTCANGGTCVLHLDGDKFYPSCFCMDGWHGDTCEETEFENLPTDWLILLMVVSIISIFALLFAICICQLNHRQNTFIKSRAEEKAIIQ